MIWIVKPPTYCSLNYQFCKQNHSQKTKNSQIQKFLKCLHFCNNDNPKAILKLQIYSLKIWDSKLPWQFQKIQPKSERYNKERYQHLRKIKRDTVIFQSMVILTDHCPLFRVALNVKVYLFQVSRVTFCPAYLIFIIPLKLFYFMANLYILFISCKSIHATRNNFLLLLLV